MNAIGKDFTTRLFMCRFFLNKDPTTNKVTRVLTYASDKIIDASNMDDSKLRKELEGKSYG